MKLFSMFRYGAIILGLSLVGCGGGDETGNDGGQDVEAQQEIPNELIDEGEEIFMGRGLCTTCHGPDATGTQLAPDLTDDEWVNIEPPPTPEKIAQVVRTGVPEPVEHNAPMPPMGGANLDDDEVEAVSAYVYSLSQ